MLEGVVVLDCSRLLPGPFATRWLAALGAQVIRVEAPGGGEAPNPLGALLDAGKARIVVDLKTEQGRRDFLRLAARADVVLESFRPGVSARLGIDYATVRAVNPRLVYVSLTGWGQTGPLAPRAAHDINYLAVAGFFGLTRDRDGRPVLPGTQVADLVGSAQAVVGILAALWERERTGRGRYLDVAMLDGAVAWQAVFLAPFLAGGPPPEPGGHALLGRYVCYNFYRTRDGRWMSLGALEPKFWRAFVDAVGRPEWLGGQWAPADGQGLHREVADLFAQRDQAAWTALGEEADCCLFPVLEAEEAWHHPQVQTRVADGPQRRTLRFPLEARPPAAPDLDGLLRSWGWSTGDIRRLRAVTAASRRPAPGTEEDA
ncbi:MAG: CoA transferase [Actinomycetia bacterium]|nr:CoA transferase [Actinomycetes bacterium]